MNRLIRDLGVLEFEGGVMKVVELEGERSLEDVEGDRDGDFENDLK
ncbi:hypothetical protein [Staphylococcus saprophyticus]|nr:hypothetical protein [Staphylococcus saprophyticus]